MEVKDVLRRNCVKLDPVGRRYDAGSHSPFYGHGRPDAEVAVALAARGGARPQRTGKPAALSV